MNIKNLLGTAATALTTQVEKADRAIKTESSHDRDANGQEAYQQQRKKEKMTEEQFEKAIALLREKSFVKDMHWVVIAAIDGDHRYACVQDQNGETIRKISEFDLWEVFEDHTVEARGQLLKRTA